MGAYKSLVIRDVELHRALKQRAVMLGVPLVSLVEKYIRQGLRRDPTMTRRDPGGGDTTRDVIQTSSELRTH
jgi:hypothetical protein